MTAASPNNYGTISRGDGEVWLSLIHIQMCIRDSTHTHPLIICRCLILNLAVSKATLNTYNVYGFIVRYCTSFLIFTDLEINFPNDVYTLLFTARVTNIQFSGINSQFSSSISEDVAGYTLHDHRRNTNTGIRQALNIMLSLIHIQMCIRDRQCVL